MVQAGQPERGFKRVRQVEVIVEIVAGDSLPGEVGIDDQRHLVGRGADAVIVLVPR